MPGKIMRFLDRHLEEYLLAVFLIVISCVMLLQIVMRYAFSSALPWPEELSRYCFVYSAFLTIGYCTQRGTMLRVDLLASLLPKGIRRLLDLLIRLCCFVFYAVLFCSSILLTQKIHATGQTTPAMGIPFSVVYCSAVIGFFLAALRGGQDVVRCISGMIHPAGDIPAKEAGA